LAVASIGAVFPFFFAWARVETETRRIADAHTQANGIFGALVTGTAWCATYTTRFFTEVFVAVEGPEAGSLVIARFSCLGSCVRCTFAGVLVANGLAGICAITIAAAFFLFALVCLGIADRKRGVFAVAAVATTSVNACTFLAFPLFGICGAFFVTLAGGFVFFVADGISTNETTTTVTICCAFDCDAFAFLAGL
jgi:hypothetical protein